MGQIATKRIFSSGAFPRNQPALAQGTRMHGSHAPLFVTTGALCHDLVHHKTAQPIHQQGQKFASDSTPHVAVQKERHVSTHMSAAGRGAMGITQQANVRPNPNPLESITTPLQHLKGGLDHGLRGV